MSHLTISERYQLVHRADLLCEPTGPLTPHYAMPNFSVLLAIEGLSRAFRIHEWNVDKCLIVWQDC